MYQKIFFQLSEKLKSRILLLFLLKNIINLFFFVIHEYTENLSSMKEIYKVQVLKPYQTIKLIWDILMVAITTINIIVMYTI